MMVMMVFALPLNKEDYLKTVPQPCAGCYYFKSQPSISKVFHSPTGKSTSVGNVLCVQHEVVQEFEDAIFIWNVLYFELGMLKDKNHVIQKQKGKGFREGWSWTDTLTVKKE